MLILSLKVAFPGQVVLLRGRHEFSTQHQFVSTSGSIGFDTCCNNTFASLGSHVYESAKDLFQWLPFGAVLAESIFVCNSGIGT